MKPFRRPKAFTLVEILVVIGIIVLLMGIVVVSMKKPGDLAKSQQTQVVISNIKSAMDELRRVNAMDKLNPIYSTPITVLPPKISGIEWVTPDSGLRNASNLLLTNTAAAIKVLQSVPVNKTNMAQLSKDRFAIFNGTPIYLDGWNNAILFIPKSGFPLAPSTSPPYFTSEGIFTADKIPSTAKPFWMSAGPDADFNTLNDNIISFKQL